MAEHRNLIGYEGYDIIPTLNVRIGVLTYVRSCRNQSRRLFATVFRHFSG